MMQISGPAATGNRGLKILGRGLVWLWLLLAMVPLIFMVSTSLKPDSIAKQLPPAWLFSPTLEHYRQIMTGGTGTSVGYDRLLLNSVIVTAGATLLTIALAVPAAYALSMRH